MLKKPELLAPAGTLKTMQYAFAYGADAVYAGQPRYSLRVRNNDFHGENLEKGIHEAHRLGKKFFLTTNIMPHNSKVRTFLEDMEPVIAMRPDALIMADPGLIHMVRERWPDMPIHLSVQANTTNYASVKFWQSIGIERIILSRELSLDEIAEIRQQAPDIELEVFVHGALCIAYSGRCLLSGYFNHRDPNQGTCTNACRWDYKTVEAVETEEGIIQKPGLIPRIDNSVEVQFGALRHPLADKIYLLEEQGRPGEQMPVMEDEHGTYIMNSKDLRAVEHVHKLVDMGIDCLKIEGRTKSYYYAARTTQSYRQAIDDAVAGKTFDPTLLADLESLASRGYTDGFYERHHTQDYQNYIQGISRETRQKVVGEVMERDEITGLVAIDVKNKFGVGDRIQLIYPGGKQDLIVEHMEDFNSNPLQEAPGSGWKVRIPIDSDQLEKAFIARYL